jgi:GNAT superfamily N-acetyltransferase
MNDISIYKDGYCISTQLSRLDLETIHDFLSNHAYWCKNIPIERVRKSVEHSLNFGLYGDHRQIGYARVISDFSTIAYLGDVFILPEFRGQGLSKWLMETILGHENLQGLRRWILLTGDAHGLYKQFGFTEIASPERWMEMYDKDVYTSSC